MKVKINLIPKILTMTVIMDNIQIKACKVAQRRLMQNQTSHYKV